MTRLLTLLLLLLVPALAQASDEAARALAAASGQWEGLLYYLDYQSGQRIGIPLQVDAEVTANGATLIQRMRFSDPGFMAHAVRITTVNRKTGRLVEAYFRDGIGERFEYDITTAEFSTNNQWRIVYEQDGRDDNRPARIRHTVTRHGDKQTSLKEVRFLDQEGSTFFMRNEAEVALKAASTGEQSGFEVFLLRNAQTLKLIGGLAGLAVVIFGGWRVWLISKKNRYDYFVELKEQFLNDELLREREIISTFWQNTCFIETDVDHGSLTRDVSKLAQQACDINVPPGPDDVAIINSIISQACGFRLDEAVVAILTSVSRESPTDQAGLAEKFAVALASRQAATAKATADPAMDALSRVLNKLLADNGVVPNSAQQNSSSSQAKNSDMLRKLAGDALAVQYRAEFADIEAKTTHVLNTYEHFGKLLQAGIIGKNDARSFFYTMVADTFIACLPYILYRRITGGKPLYAHRMQKALALLPMTSLNLTRV